jgi:hypothetical protein
MTGDGDGGMRIVSSNSAAELAAQRALDELGWPLSQLAANMLRVVRGAGRPAELEPQMAAVIAIFDRYRAATGAFPGHYEIVEAISLRAEANARKHTDKWSHAIDDIVQGSLQIAASQLLGQSTQEAAGRHEVMEGVATIEAIREANRVEALARRQLASKSITRKVPAKSKRAKRGE